MDALLTGLACGAAVVAVILVWLLASSFGPWFKARAAGHPVPFRALIGMYFRKVPRGRLVEAHLSARKRKVDCAVELLEIHLLAGGDPGRAVEAACLLREKGRPADWRQAAALDLAFGGEVLDLIRQDDPRIARLLPPRPAVEAEGKSPRDKAADIDGRGRAGYHAGGKSNQDERWEP